MATISIAGHSVDSDALILFSGIMLSQGFRNQDLTTIYKQLIPNLFLLFVLNFNLLFGPT
jgi:hypothetical protein